MEMRAADSGKARGLIVGQDAAIALCRAGKQVLIGAAETSPPLHGADQITITFDNGKFLTSPAVELPEMLVSKGVEFPAYREGGLREIADFNGTDGLATVGAGRRARTSPKWGEEQGPRAQAGKDGAEGLVRDEAGHAAVGRR